VSFVSGFARWNKILCQNVCRDLENFGIDFFWQPKVSGNQKFLATKSFWQPKVSGNQKFLQTKN
jgi:hypothetical protein